MALGHGLQSVAKSGIHQKDKKKNLLEAKSHWQLDKIALDLVVS